MKHSHWIVAGLFAAALGCGGSAFADHEKGHHGKGYGGRDGKWRHGGPGCHSMSPEKRELLHGAMKKSHEANAALMKQMHDRHQAMEKVLGAKKFDAAAFLKVYDELAGLKAQKHRNMAEAFAGVAGKLTPEERKKCAMFLAGGMHHRGGMRHHGWKGGPGRHGEGHGMMMKRHHDGPPPHEAMPETAGKPAPSYEVTPADKTDWRTLNK